MNPSWDSADSYDAFMGRWSRLLAHEFLAWLRPQPGLDWLEVGCGTGALTRTILELAEPSSILACDPSAAFIRHARRHIPDKRVAFVVADAEAIPEPNQALNACASGLLLNFIQDPENAIGRIAHLLDPGSTIAGYVWDYADGVEFLRIFWDAATKLDSSAADHDQRRRYPICAPDPLRSLFQTAGLSDVSVHPLEITARFANFSDYWTPFLGGTGAAPTYLQTLEAEHRSKLEDSLRRRFSSDAGDSFDLAARAWAVRGST